MRKVVKKEEDMGRVDPREKKHQEKKRFWAKGSLIWVGREKVEKDERK